MRRAASLLLLSVLAACASQGGPKVPLVSEVVRSRPANPMCRIGPDGGPLLAERGIGGTGSPMGSHWSATGGRQADRGIGGTGIVGIVTGFASVCVDGLEVPYDVTTAIDHDGAPAAAADLRVGEIVAIQATGPGNHPFATAISVRRELTGRIEAVSQDTGLATIAGQPVAVQSDTEGADHFGIGDWVSVSGLWRADGVLSATRIDSAPAGRLVAHGQVVLDHGVAKLGSLVLPPDQAALATPGQYVVATGGYWSGEARVSAVSRDILASDPASWFGGGARRLVLQGYVLMAGGRLHLHGLELTAAPGVTAGAASHSRRDGLAVVTLERRPDGGYVAVGVHYADQGGSASRRSRGRGTAAMAPPPVSPSQSLAPVSLMFSQPGPNPAAGAASDEAAPGLLTSLLDTPVWPPVTWPGRPQAAKPTATAPVPANAAPSGPVKPDQPVSSAVPGTSGRVQDPPPAHPEEQEIDPATLMSSTGGITVAGTARPHRPAATPGPALAAASRQAVLPAGPASISLVAQTDRSGRPSQTARHAAAPVKAGGPTATPSAPQ